MDIEINSYKETINLNIGELVVIEKTSKIVHTLLGSCISIIFYVPNVISMVSHAQMPFSTDGKCVSKNICKNICGRKFDYKNSFRYVTCTLDYMINYTKIRGIKTEDIQVTLLGGASILDKINEQDSIGTRNLRTALEIIQKNNMKISRKFIGGNSGITLWYYSDTDKLEIMKHNDRIRFEL